MSFEEVKQLLAEKDSKETFVALRYQLNYRKQNGLCVSNLAKDADANSEDCTYTDYTLDKTDEDALILSSGDGFNIYGEERLSTESDDERLTYIGSLNQSVMQTVKDDLKKENPKQTLSILEYDDAGNTLDITSGFGYNGEKLDETGNIYLRARYYNPRIGQFVQIDSFRGNQGEIETQNRYTYVANNQYKYVDPSGHFFGTFAVIALGAAAIGTGIAAAGAVIAYVAFNIYIKSFFVEGTEQLVKEGVVEFAGNILKKGFKNSYDGEKFMRDTYHATKRTFKNVDFVMDGVSRSANRMVDGFVEGVAHESKVGYMALTKRLKEEALKDVALLASGDINKAVWHFYKSAVTGKIGPSGPLESFLKGLGIIVEIHR